MPHHRSSSFQKIPRLLLLAGLGFFVAGCVQTPTSRDADVIVVGAGIAGLSAALEAAAQGAQVLVIETNSIGGGHAVKAGGLAMVGTALQRQRGIEDSPQLALGDWVEHGEDPDPYWTWRYAAESGSEVYDWLTGLGVEFVTVVPTPADSVPRFHFTRGTAINVVVPMMHKALYDLRINWVWNTQVTGLVRTEGEISGVRADNLRTGKRMVYRAPSVILATGGFQGNLDLVREYWPADSPQPEKLLDGAGHFAEGDGYTLARWAGAVFRNMERQTTFLNGIPDPSDPGLQRGLVASNPAAIWVNVSGRRFMNESADSKTAESVIGNLQPQGWWMVFDARGAESLSVRDAGWLSADTVRADVLSNPDITASAPTLDELAVKAGLPPRALRATGQTWNRMIEHGEDYRYGRFDRSHAPAELRPLLTPPFYALRMYPLTRKSLGGPVIDPYARVLDAGRTPIPGLYAAGELTGAAGINGKYGGAGTFLGPGVFTGRIAGRDAARRAAAVPAAIHAQPADGGRTALSMMPDAPGYWHYTVVHRLVTERDQPCADCHTSSATMVPADSRQVFLARLETCSSCH